MSPITPYIALASLPLAACLALNPTRFSWGFHHGFERMPAPVLERAESIDRYMLFVRDGMAAAFIAILMFWQSVPATRVGIRLGNWKSSVALGIAAGLLRIAVQGVVIKVFPNGPFQFGTEYLQRRSALLWVSVYLAGSFAEEFWIAFCLVAFVTTRHSLAFAVAATAAVFGALHFEYRFGALSIASLGVVSAMLFLWRGSLFPSFLFHFVGNLGSLYWVRRRESQGNSQVVTE